MSALWAWFISVTVAINIVGVMSIMMASTHDNEFIRDFMSPFLVFCLVFTDLCLLVAAVLEIVV